MAVQTVIGSISTLDGTVVAERGEIIIDEPKLAEGGAPWTGHFASSATPDLEPGIYRLTLDDGRGCDIEIGHVGPFPDYYVIGLGDLYRVGDAEA
jgi:hypothetical protein